MTVIEDGFEVIQEMKMNFSNFNEIDEIVVPEDIKNSAKDY
jgi:hypothetical protein